MSKARSNYWDSCKGLAILAVILTHANGESGNFPSGSFNWYFGLVLRQLINFAVPLFLGLSGFFAVRSANNFGFNYYSSRLKRILLPYLFWTVVFILHRYPSHLFSPIAILKDVFLGKGIGVGYFVIVLVQCILITPIILKIKKSWHHILIMVTVSVTSMFIMYSVRINHAESVFAEFPHYALPFFAWYPFYHLGIYVAQRREDTIDRLLLNSRLWFALFLLFTIASIIEGLYFAHRGFYIFGASQIKATGFLVSIALFMFAISYYKEDLAITKNAFIPWLGKHSYLIYLTHLLFLAQIRNILINIPFVFTNQPFYIFLTTILTIGGCAILIRFVSFAFSDMFRKKYLGF